jgi:hypothetical protein
LAEVIPLRRDAELVERPQVAMPEPVRLYGLVCLALLLHVPDGRTFRCCRCGESWPCDQVRLAWRLREGW